MPTPSRRLLAAVLSIVVAIPATTVVAATGVTAASCAATNARTKATVTSLKTAIKNARAGDTITVKGTCVGAFAIGKNLKLTGAGTAPTLKGGATGTVVTVATAARVTLTGLTITGGKGIACKEWSDFTCAGGILNKGTLTLDKVVVQGNAPTHVTDHGVLGAGIYNVFSGTMTIKRSTIRDNTATAPDDWAQGAGILNEGVMTITGSAISANSTNGVTESDGGGIYNAGTTTGAGHDAIGRLTISNSTISGNGAYPAGTANVDGGGIYSEAVADALVLRYVTITGNYAGEGGGIFSPGPLEMEGALIAANFISENSPDCVAGAELIAVRTLLGVNDGCGITVPGNGNQAGGIGDVLDPKLGELKANGGPTRTHALLTGSPAIDAAGGSPCALAKDQRGITRPRGTACDIGAFEKG